MIALRHWVSADGALPWAEVLTRFQCVKSLSVQSGLAQVCVEALLALGYLDVL
jgi:hypothetical protein